MNEEELNKAELTPEELEKMNDFIKLLSDLIEKYGAKTLKQIKKQKGAKNEPRR